MTQTRNQWLSRPGMSPSHEIEFPKDDADRARKARLAAAHWLGFRNYRVVAYLLRDIESEKRAQFICHWFANFDGYPVTAIYNYWRE